MNIHTQHEDKVKGILVKEIRIELPTFVTIRHEDHFTYGIPDISITGNKRTLWIEVKFANPNFKSRGIQDLTMLRLAKNGYAFYVIYQELQNKEQYTFIVEPKDIGAPIDSWMNYIPGFNHHWVIGQIKQVLNDNN